MKLFRDSHPTLDISDKPSELLLRSIYIAFFLQLLVIVYGSLLGSSGPSLVHKYIFGLDFFDFYNASTDWMHGINPYIRVRFVTPPPSILVGLFLHWAGFGGGRYLFAVINLILVLLSVKAIANWLRLSRKAGAYLMAIALLDYPVMFLVERGNIDGLVLSCLAFAVVTSRPWLRGGLISLSAGLKVYGILLLVPFVWQRQWKMAAGILLGLILLLLPFAHLVAPFGKTLLVRGTELKWTENLSPSLIFLEVSKKMNFPKIYLWTIKAMYLVFWAGTLLLALLKERENGTENLVLPYLPWMVAFPMQVFPYTGVLLLPVLAWKMRQLDDRMAAQPNSEPLLKLPDKLFLAGFLLVGVQAWAMSQCFGWFVDSRLFFPALNSFGMLLILVGMAFQQRHYAARKQASQITLP